MSEYKPTYDTVRKWYKVVIADTCIELEDQFVIRDAGRFPKVPYEMTDSEALPVIMEELGEVARVMCDKPMFAGPEYDTRLREELIQVAAVAISWAARIPVENK